MSKWLGYIGLLCQGIFKLPPRLNKTGHLLSGIGN